MWSCEFANATPEQLDVRMNSQTLPCCAFKSEEQTDTKFIISAYQNVILKVSVYLLIKPWNLETCLFKFPGHFVLNGHSEQVIIFPCFNGDILGWDIWFKYNFSGEQSTPWRSCIFKCTLRDLRHFVLNEHKGQWKMAGFSSKFSFFFPLQSDWRGSDLFITYQNDVIECLYII
jgi:hypothetical protein